MLSPEEQSRVLREVVPNATKRLMTMIDQRLPAASNADKKNMMRSVIAHMLASSLSDTSLEEVENFAVIVGDLLRQAGAGGS